MLFQRHVAMRADMQRQTLGKGCHRWYDLRRKVSEINHGTFFWPARAFTRAGLLVDLLTLLLHPYPPVVPCQLPVTPRGDSAH